jgi:hypothetical protein
VTARYTRVLPQEQPDAHSLAQLRSSKDEGVQLLWPFLFCQNKTVSVQCVLLGWRARQQDENLHQYAAQHRSTQPRNERVPMAEASDGHATSRWAEGYAFSSHGFQETPKGKCDKTLVTLANPWSSSGGSTSDSGLPLPALAAQWSLPDTDDGRATMKSLTKAKTIELVPAATLLHGRVMIEQQSTINNQHTSHTLHNNTWAPLHRNRVTLPHSLASKSALVQHHNGAWCVTGK